MKLISTILTFSLLLSSSLTVTAQNQTASRYDAELLIKNGSNVDKKAVVISQKDGVLSINGRKDRKIAKSFASGGIKNAAYSYSDKPQIKEAIITSLLLNNWLVGIPFFFNKTKKHWLVLSTENEALLFELQKDSYRRLLLDLSAHGIKVEDLGDKDRKEPYLPYPKADAGFIQGNSCGNVDEPLR